MNKYLQIDVSEIKDQKEINKLVKLLENFLKPKYYLDNLFYKTYNINRSNFPWKTICQVRISDYVYCECSENNFKEVKELFEKFMKYKTMVKIKVRM